MKHDARLARLERRRTLASIDDTIIVRIVDYDGSVIASYQLSAHTGTAEAEIVRWDLTERDRQLSIVGSHRGD